MAASAAASLTRHHAQYHNHVLRNLPAFSHAFCYGASVLFPQNKINKTRMLDYIVAVDDARSWHAENIDKNPQHYSRLAKLFGNANNNGSALSQLSNSIGCGVHFNAFVAIDEPNASVYPQQMYKYGVVEVARLTRDLEAWDDLYVAGRMQKPHQRCETSNTNVEKLNRGKNLRAALAFALLSQTMDEDVNTFGKQSYVDETKIYEAIANLSYDGDVRFMFGAEDRNKAKKLARESLEAMREWYDESLRDFRDSLDSVLDFRDEVREDGSTHRTIRRDISPSTTRKLLAALPTKFLQNIFDGDLSEFDSMVREANAKKISDLIRATARKIVRRSSMRQTMYAALTTDFGKATSYAMQKFSK